MFHSSSSAWRNRAHLFFTAVLLSAVNLCTGEELAPSQPQPLALTDGLILHYTFDNNSGSNVVDQSGMGHTGVVHGAATWVPDGLRGGGMSFNGTNTTFLQSSDSGFPFGDAPRSIAFWFKLREGGVPALGEMLFYGTGSNNQLCGFGMDWRLGRNSISMTQHGGVFVGATKMTFGQWYHVVYTYGGGGAHKFYINGQESSGHNEISSINTQSSGKFVIGKDGYVDAYHFDGTIDDVRVYNRTLSASESQQLFSDAFPQSLNSGMVMHYTFDQNNGSNLVDQSGFGNTGIVDGATWTANGMQGGAYQFDGTNDCLTLNNASLTIPVTVSLWFRSVQTNSLFKTLFGWQSSSSPYNGIQIYADGMGKIATRIGANDYAVTTLDRVDGDNLWHCLAISRGADNIHRLYIDGNFQTSAVVTASIGTTHAMYIGRSALVLSSNEFFRGNIDDVRIYNRTLSLLEVQQLFVDRFPEPPTNSLVLRYTFDQDNGSNAVDQSGNGNNGTISGATWAAGGVKGGAYQFDGTNDYIKVLSNPTTSNSYTVAMWFTSASSNNFAGGSQLCSYNRRYQLGAHFKDGQECFYSYCLNAADYGSGSGVDSDPVQIIDGAWYHIALVVNGAEPRLTFYLNGRAIGSGTGTGAVNAGSLEMLLGAMNNDSRYGPRYFWQGKLDEVLIYSRALSAGEVLGLANKRQPFITLQPAGGHFRVGTRVVLNIEAYGDPLPALQWKKNGEVLVGATNATLVLNPIQMADAGEYRVVLSNEAGMVSSDPAVVVVDAVSVTAAIGPGIVPLGGHALLGIGPVIGESPMFMQWYRNGVPQWGAACGCDQSVAVSGQCGRRRCGRLLGIGWQCVWNS